MTKTSTEIQNYILTNLTDGKLINDSRSDELPNIPMLSLGTIF